MDISSIPYKTLQCSRCFEETSYYCEWCLDDLCSNCKESHSKDLKTIDHNVVPYRNKFNSIQQQKKNAKHSNFVCRKYCESCEVPVFRHCKLHKKQKMLDVRKAYITKREQVRLYFTYPFFCQISKLISKAFTRVYPSINRRW